jgi:hypothetical protein
MDLLSNLFLKNQLNIFTHFKIFHLYFYSNRSFIFDKKMLFYNNNKKQCFLVKQYCTDNLKIYLRFVLNSCSNMESKSNYHARLAKNTLWYTHRIYNWEAIGALVSWICVEREDLWGEDEFDSESKLQTDKLTRLQNNLQLF